MERAKELGHQGDLDVSEWGTSLLSKLILLNALAWLFNDVMLTAEVMQRFKFFDNYYVREMERMEEDVVALLKVHHAVSTFTTQRLKSDLFLIDTF